MTTDWKRELQLLKAYQDAHMAIELAGQRIAQIAAERQAALTALEALRAQVVSLEANQSHSETARRSLEGDVEVDRARCKELETRLYSVKTDKEYQARLKEIAEVKLLIRNREEKILQLMEQLEKIMQDRTQLSVQCADTESVCATQCAAFDVATADAEQTRSAAQASVAQLATELSAEVKEFYHRTQRRHLDALAVVTHGVCRGCNMRVPPQRYNELRRFEKILDCPTCHRILFCDPSEVVAQAS